MNADEGAVRYLTARYSFRGADDELSESLPLTVGEIVTLHGACRLSRPWHLPRQCIVRVTDRRLSLLLHHAFGPDPIIDIDRSCITAVALHGRRLHIAWSAAEQADAIRLRPWSGRAYPARPIEDLTDLNDTLTTKN